MNTITTKDGTQIYYKDWGKGQPIVFSGALRGDISSSDLMPKDLGLRILGQGWPSGHGQDSASSSKSIGRLGQVKKENRDWSALRWSLLQTFVTSSAVRTSSRS